MHVCVRDVSGRTVSKVESTFLKIIIAFPESKKTRGFLISLFPCPSELAVRMPTWGKKEKAKTDRYINVQASTRYFVEVYMCTLISSSFSFIKGVEAGD